MPLHRYPFVAYEDEKTGTRRSLAWIPIRLRNPLDDLSLDVYALIDTGADASVFPASLATELGHDLKGDGVESHFTYGVGAGKVATYRHTFEVGLISSRSDRIVWTSGRRSIDCVESGIPPILGVADFLLHFRVTIDYPRRMVTLRW